MKYVALLRGINVGGKRKVEMKKLKVVFESLGCSDVRTYLNSGNVIFSSSSPLSEKKTEQKLLATFGFEIPLVITTQLQIKKIAKSIPSSWQNDSLHQAYVAYLCKSADSPSSIKKLPIKPEYIDARYVPGAIIWCVERKNYYKSGIHKLIECELYQQITTRNVNTARKLAQL